MKRWGWLSYVWLTIVNIVQITLITIMFSSLYYASEETNIIAALVVFCYIAIKESSIVHDSQFIHLVKGIHAEFSRLKERDVFEAESDTKNFKAIAKIDNKTIINSIGLLIVFFITLVNFIQAI